MVEERPQAVHSLSRRFLPGVPVGAWAGVAMVWSSFAMPAALAEPGRPPEEIRFFTRYDIEGRQPANMVGFLRQYPEVRLKAWSGITLPAGGASASLAMAMAADDGPDLFESDIRQSVIQGMAYPLSEWIGRDGVLRDGAPKLRADGTPDLNGRVDEDEAKWDGWMRIPPLFRQVVTVEGVPYALPGAGSTYVGLLYSKKLVRKAGLDPMHPPADWEDFVGWCRMLYNRKTRTPAVDIPPEAWAFAPWVAAAGDSMIVQERKSPTTGKTYVFGEQELELTAEGTGEDLSGVTPVWRVNVDGPGGRAAAALYHRLRWAPWMMDPATGRTIELSGAEVAAGQKEVGGRVIRFGPEEVFEGCITTSSEGLGETINRFGGSVGMVVLWAADFTEFETRGMPPADLGMLAFPPRERGGRPVLQASNFFNLMGKDVAHRGGRTRGEREFFRNRVWDVLKIMSSDESASEQVRRKVAAGMARFLNPQDLRRLGLEDYIAEIPAEDLALWLQIEDGSVREVVEPFMGQWLQFRQILQREVIDLIFSASGREFDYEAALGRLNREGNSGTMLARSQSELDQHRPVARIVAALVILACGWGVWMIVKDQLGQSVRRAGVYHRWLPWAMLVPAVLSVALWGYYPLIRGAVMAFQDYQIGGGTRFVGLDNFIGIALDPNFYHYAWTTLRFVFWSFVLGFFAPIVLALLLSEVPRGKIFFRTLFFLPQMTSGIVVGLMWKEMFSGAPSGTVNQVMGVLFGWAGFQPADWLGDPATVMACVILPGIWAGAGLSSLIYLAALKSVSDELYEAASIDGAGLLTKIRTITLPTIFPLILINMIGAFIGAFQSMGSIFLLTFGGPGKETMVMSMAIWQEAYVNLRFSLATSYAWILGSALLGFTYLQLKLLRRMDFRRAKGD